MNLTSRRARTLLALCSVGAIVGAGVTATSANAAGETLAYGPTNTSATVVNLDPASAAGAPVTYGVKVTGSTNTDTMTVNELTTPTNGALYVQKAIDNAAAAANPAATAVTTRVAADGVTTNGDATVTSATAAFTLADAGAAISGTGIPGGAIILSVTSSTEIELSANATADGDPVPLTITNLSRQVTDGVTNTDTSLTSATAAFTSADVGASVVGSGIAGGTTIASVTNATTVVLSAATTATATGVTVGIEPTALAGSSTASSTTFTADANTLGNLNGHFVKISKTGETTEIAKVASTSGTALTLDRKVLAHAGASLTDLGVATGGDFFSTVTAGNAAPVTYSGTAWATPDNVYFGAVVPGTYTFQLFKDHNGNGVYESGQDDATPVFTLTVKDVNATTTATSDDLSPTLSVASSAGVGENVTATVNTGLTTTDTRGLNGGTPNVGVLGVNIATASTLSFDGTSLPNTGTGSATTSFDGTSVSRTSGPAVAGAGVTTYTIGSNISKTANTTVADNTVATVDEDVTDVVGSVKDDTGTAARAVHVKVGVSDVTYKATVKNATPAVVSGATVLFTLTTGTNTPALTADGTLLSSTSTTKVYTAVSDSSGVATLKVTSGTTTAGTTYTVLASTNGHDSDLLSAAYEAVAATTLENTNTAASLIVTPGSSATLTGKLLDQFGAAYVPSGSDSVQVAVRIPAGSTTVGNAAISSGLFSYTYTPTTTPTAGTQTTFDFYYDTTTLDGTDSAINWASTATPSSVTITAPVAATSVTQQKATITPGAGTLVTGSVLDASNAALAYKTVTLSGTAGLYFSDVATPTTATTDDLATTITVASNGSGVYSGYAFATKAGSATITVTSGSATKTVDVTVTQAADPYAVTASDATVEPGGASVVSGEVHNGFGYPVSGTNVSLSLGATTAATLGATTVTTNSEGVWSTTVTGASGGSGTATLTASLAGQTTNATAHDDWLDNAGLTIANGTYQTTATVTVDPTINATTLTGPTSQVGAGYAALSGTAKASTPVEVYAKASASSAAYGLVGMVISDTDGSWNSTQYISTTTTFFAKTAYSTSSPITVTVEAESTPTPEASTVTLSAKAVGGGKVYLVGDGGPTGYGVMKFYTWTGSSWQYIAGVIANPNGDYGFYYKTTTGSKTFRCVYIAPDHAAAGANATVTVK